MRPFFQMYWKSVHSAMTLNLNKLNIIKPNHSSYSRIKQSNTSKLWLSAWFIKLRWNCNFKIIRFLQILFARFFLKCWLSLLIQRKNTWKISWPMSQVRNSKEAIHMTRARKQSKITDVWVIYQFLHLDYYRY